MDLSPVLPSDEELLDLVRQWPGIYLRQLGAVIWPELSWSDISQNAPPPGMESATLALWLRDRMRLLLAQGRLQLAPFHVDEPGIAGLAYFIPAG